MKAKRTALIILLFVSFVLFWHFTAGSLARSMSDETFLSLDRGEVVLLLKGEKTVCTNFNDCVLQPGDILIRRLDTPRVHMMLLLIRPFFTHMAVYLGGGKIAESVGKEHNYRDEIVINTLNDTEWKTETAESFVVIRPNISDSQRETILNEIASIAKNDNYRFGTNTLGYERTCVSLIYLAFMDHDVVEKAEVGFMTPDFFVQYAVQHPKIFKVVGSGL